MKNKALASQSLWNRAVSYDVAERINKKRQFCLNPFGAGQCLTTVNRKWKPKNYRCLNPFGTGQCLTTAYHLTRFYGKTRLNPFGTGQCLTT